MLTTKTPGENETQALLSIHNLIVFLLAIENLYIPKIMQGATNDLQSIEQPEAMNNTSFNDHSQMRQFGMMVQNVFVIQQEQDMRKMAQYFKHLVDCRKN